MTSSRQLKPFTPTREDPDDLIARTVGRQDVRRALGVRIRAAATTGDRGHTLLVGPRGSGKTHLLSIVLRDLQLDTEIDQRVLVARLDEDVVGISTYSALLRAIRLSIGSSNRSPMSTPELESDIEEVVAGRTLVLALENMDRLFSALGLAGQRDLRSFVQDSGSIIIFGTTPLLSADFTARSHPWYGSFSFEYLDELSESEGMSLLQARARADGDEELYNYLGSQAGRARVAALARITGGSPRLWALASDCISVELLDDLVQAVETMLETLVTYYQQLLWELPPGESEIVRALALGSPLQSVSEIAEAVGRDARQVSVTLKRLSEKRWVAARKLPGTDQRRTWFGLREPLLRHHFQYRGMDTGPLDLVVELLKAWFDNDTRYELFLSSTAATETESYLVRSLTHSSVETSSGIFIPPDDFAERARSGIAFEGRSLLSSESLVACEALAALLSGTTYTEAMRVVSSRRVSPAAHDRIARALRSVSTDGRPLGAETLTEGIAALSQEFAQSDDAWFFWRYLRLLRFFSVPSLATAVDVIRLPVEHFGPADAMLAIAAWLRVAQESVNHLESVANARAQVDSLRTLLTGADFDTRLTLLRADVILLYWSRQPEEAIRRLMDLRPEELGLYRTEDMPAFYWELLFRIMKPRPINRRAVMDYLSADWMPRLMEPESARALSFATLAYVAAGRVDEAEELASRFARLSRSQRDASDSSARLATMGIALEVALDQRDWDLVRAIIVEVSNLADGLRFDLGAGGLKTRLISAALQLLAHNEHAPMPDEVGRLGQSPQWQLISDLEAAAFGDHEALTSLPDELRTLIS